MNLIEILTNALTVVVTLKWILILIAFAILAAAYAERVHDVRLLRAEIDDLSRTVAQRDETIRRLRGLVGAMRRRHRAPIIAGPAR